ncbi:MAG: TetR/AcrR family transcriptional regulator [Nocardioidaceae bacterium]
MATEATQRPVPTRRERQRQATLDEIVEVSRSLLTDPAGLSLRAVANRMGITAPALYRYVASYQELVYLLAADIDAETARMLAIARDTQPADDPVARITCSAIAFRRWALSHKEEFSLVFANPLTAHDAERADDIKDVQTGQVFTDLLLQIWGTFQFPIPAVADLDPAVVEALRDPLIPAKVEEIPEEALGLVWVFMQSWAALYGTVTLEVFGHCDPRVISSGALFRSMLASQGDLLGISGELDRLQPTIDAELAR